MNIDRGYKYYIEHFIDTNEQQEDLDGKGNYYFHRLSVGPRKKCINLITQKNLGTSIKYYVYYDTEVSMYGCNRVKFGNEVINIEINKSYDLFLVLNYVARMVYCHLSDMDFEKTPLSFYYKD